MDKESQIRAHLAQEINSRAGDREALEAEHGKVWNTWELQEDYVVEGFAAPFVLVTCKKTKRKGTLLFQHAPRFYYSFQPSRGAA